MQVHISPSRELVEPDRVIVLGTNDARLDLAHIDAAYSPLGANIHFL